MNLNIEHMELDFYIQRTIFGLIMTKYETENPQFHYTKV